MTETVTKTQHDEIREKVREGYAEVATRSGGCCGGDSSAVTRSRRVGYEDGELAAIPEEANLGVGCGNPTALAGLAKGETVIDLGSGAGIDCFLAANAVGPDGHVIGIDMTDEMLEKARHNAARGGYTNVEFRKGFIEELPIEDETADLVISNCVINLSPSKASVFREVHRVLRPGGRMVISDIVMDRDLPPAVRKSVEAWVGCVAGAMRREAYLEAIRSAGFREVEVLSESSYGNVFTKESADVQAFAREMNVDPETVTGWASSVVSIKVRAVR